MTDPRVAPRAMTQEGMFWEFVPENVIEIPVERKRTDFLREWRSRKTQWKGRQEDCVRMQSKNETVKPICTEGFLGNFHGRYDAHFRHANVQSKAVSPML